ncbi:3-hydroxyacyl-CoA dehydrogenase family protein [Shimia sediminis]|uniref:3-hydroxyacyl-CoA dehydrogenase family protein n=1 Tax=Shimia sediminis TaxID=2497945 RepID=UPI000F8DFA26|nr:3-hydroxyacyl-CoA dehydrogenase family protein [Shimia sediminis]
MDIQNIGVLGAGTMGAGITITAAMGGFDVTLSDSSQEALTRAAAQLTKYTARQVDKGRMTEAEAEAVNNRLTVSCDIAALAGSDLVVEAVFEDMSVKRQVFGTLETIVSDACVLATNTSALKVDHIAEALIHKGRFCGLHYFSPAEVNPVVEVIRGTQTADATLDAVLPFLAQCHKIAIRCLDQSGFALNRFFCPYTNEAVRCLEAGLGTHAQIDAVAKDTLGVAIGPFFVMNIVKPSINLTAVQNLAHLGKFYAASPEFVRVGKAKALWEIDIEAAELDPAAAAAISDRLRGAIFYAVLDEIAEGVATAEDIDTGAEKAFTFASGPVKMMRNLGFEETTRLLGLVAPGKTGHLKAPLQSLVN